MPAVAGAAAEPATKPYAAFVSHYKAEAAMEARFLQMELESELGRRVFLDSDDLKDLRLLKDAVLQSDVLVLLQSSRIYERPWCLIELITALTHRIPIIGVSLTSGNAPYDFADAVSFLSSLDTALEHRNPSAPRVLHEHDSTPLLDVAWMLSSTLPGVISVAFNPSASKNMLRASITDMVASIRTAQPLEVAPKEEWLRKRRRSAVTSHGRSTRAPSASASRASIPPDVPLLPASMQARPALLSTLKQAVLEPIGRTTAVTAAARSAAQTTAASGMGGVGKTMLAAQLVRDPDVGTAFECLLWVSVSAEPDLMQRLRVLYSQLTGGKLPESVDEEREAMQELSRAARGVKALLVLDDCWQQRHVTALNCVDAEAGSVCVITTRIRNLADEEVSCGLLSLEESLSILLTSAGLTHLIDDPPDVAIEACEACGRLALALPIAGAMIAELDDLWEAELMPLLRSGELLDELSVEERIVTASLGCVPHSLRAGVEALFMCFAVFQEDAVVPVAVLDVLAPHVCSMAGLSAVTSPHLKVRKWLAALLKASLLLGSSADGIHMHDLLRDISIHRAEAREGGLRAMQREMVSLLLLAFDGSGPAAGYVTSSLDWHVREAQQPQVDVAADSLLMRVLTHSNGDIRKQGAIGVTVDKLLAAADTCDTDGDHLRAAELIWATCAVRGQAAGGEARRAWTSLQQLEEEGRGSPASRALESAVLNTLLLATQGGFAFGSEEQTAVMARMKVLGEREVAAVSSGECGAGAPSKEEMEAILGLSIVEAMPAFTQEGVTGYLGPMTHEKVVQAHGYWRRMAAQNVEAVALAPDAPTAVAVWSLYAFPVIGVPRQHILPEFVPEEMVGEGGARLRETIERYDFDSVDPAAKQMFHKIDTYLYGMEPLGLLLWFGDLQAARAGFARLLDAHRRILERMRSGEATADEYGWEAVLSVMFLVTALLAAGALHTLRDYLEHSPIGAMLHDEALQAGAVAVTHVVGWTTDDGHTGLSAATILLTVRGLWALVEEDTHASRAALQEWLPPPAELLRLAEFECYWRSEGSGTTHPALLLARLRGERLGDWEAAAEVAQGVLQMEAFHPMVRTEACRLLGCARHALGARAAACEAAEAAVAEATKARYVWLVVASLCDLLKWCAATEADGVRLRLRAVAARCAASREELAQVFGESVL